MLWSYELYCKKRYNRLALIWKRNTKNLFYSNMCVIQIKPVYLHTCTYCIFYICYGCYILWKNRVWDLNMGSPVTISVWLPDLTNPLLRFWWHLKTSLYWRLESSTNRQLQILPLRDMSVIRIPTVLQHLIIEITIIDCSLQSLKWLFESLHPSIHPSFYPFSFNLSENEKLNSKSKLVSPFFVSKTIQWSFTFFKNCSILNNQ